MSMTPEIRAEGAAVVQERARAFAETVWPVVEEARRGGHSLAAVARLLNLGSVPAPRGGQWNAEQVRRLERRMQGDPLPNAPQSFSTCPRCGYSRGGST